VVGTWKHVGWLCESFEVMEITWRNKSIDLRIGHRSIYLDDP
jgi:hypothetical protein